MANTVNTKVCGTTMEKLCEEILHMHYYHQKIQHYLFVQCGIYWDNSDNEYVAIIEYKKFGDN